jgi:hypothetical protein
VDYGMAAAVITSPTPPEPAEQLPLQYIIPNTVTVIH